MVTAGRAAKRFNMTVGWTDLTLRILAAVIVVVLIVFANLARPVQLADITPLLDPSLYLGPFAVTGGGHVDHGSVPLQVTGVLTEAAGFVDALELDTRPSGGSGWQKQPGCCTILGSSFSGSASLSVASARAFDFQLVSIGDNNPPLATGTLTVHVESFPGGNQLAINIIAGLGLAAVVLPILRLVVRRRTTPEPAPSTTQGEPNAKEQ